jgi:hypothetical protein
MWRVCNMHLCVEYTPALLTQWPKFANQKQEKHAPFDPLSKILRKLYRTLPTTEFQTKSSLKFFLCRNPFFLSYVGEGGGGGGGGGGGVRL